MREREKKEEKEEEKKNVNFLVLSALRGKTMEREK